jgi:hypothetical protein
MNLVTGEKHLHDPLSNSFSPLCSVAGMLVPKSVDWIKSWEAITEARDEFYIYSGVNHPKSDCHIRENTITDVNCIVVRLVDGFRIIAVKNGIFDVIISWGPTNRAVRGVRHGKEDIAQLIIARYRNINPGDTPMNAHSFLKPFHFFRRTVMIASPLLPIST